MSGLLLAALDQTIVATALPSIVASLSGAEKLSWVVTAYLLTTTVVTPLYGKLGDVHGRKPVFSIAIVIFLLGSALCGLATSMWQLIAARAVQGLGAGGIFPLVLATIGDIVPLRERAKYQGLFGAVFGLSSVIGPVLGGVLTEHASWRWVFYINMPVGAVALYLVARHLHVLTNRVEHRIDWLGAALVAAGTSALLLVTVWGGKQYEWGSTTIIALSVCAVVLLGAFVAVQHRAAEPLLPLGMFANRAFSVSVAISFLSGLALFGALIFVTVYLQTVKGYSPTQSGLMLLPLTFGIFPSSILSGTLISRTGRVRPFPIAGMTVLGAAFAMLSRVDASTPYSYVGAVLFVAGVGMGLVVQTPTVVAQNVVERQYLGVATGAVTFFRTIGASFGTALFGAVLTARIAAHTPAGAPVAGGAQSPEPAAGEATLSVLADALADVFLVAVPFAILGMLVAIAMPKQRLENIEPAGPTE